MWEFFVEQVDVGEVHAFQRELAVGIELHVDHRFATNDGARIFQDVAFDIIVVVRRPTAPTSMGAQAFADDACFVHR